MSEHTPGPWNCSQESVDPEWWIVTIKGGLIVANVNAHHNQEANARLIAAAPDLLDALDDALGELQADSHRDGARCLLLTKIEAAIAKAKGGAS